MGGDLVGLAILAVFAVASLANRRRQLRELAAHIRELRFDAIAPISYEPIDARWEDLVAGLEMPPGLTGLGDFVEVVAGKGRSNAVRCFVDASGTVFGWLAKVRAGPSALTTMMMFSATEHDVYMTRVTPRAAGAIASPPFLHREDVAFTRMLAGALGRHRDRIANAKGLVRVTTAAQLHAEVGRMRERTIAWRAAQAPETLLDRDLRSLLGQRYDSLAPRLAKHLAIEMPTARVVA
jgi:hypothetical protein